MPGAGRVPVDGAVPVGSLALLGVSVVAVASAAVLSRWADAPAVSQAFWRTAAGATVLAPLSRRGRPPAGRPEAPVPWGLVAVAGLALGVHFGTWLASLERTSVAASVTLVSTAPVFVTAHLAATGRRPSTRTLAATALAVVGMVVITGGGALDGGGSAHGDGLALVGAATMAVYLIAGQRARTTLATAAYASRTYAVAALALLPVALLTGAALGGYDARTWLALLAMVIGPQLAGHTLVNHLLDRLGTVTVSLALLLEPVGAAVLTWAAFGEVPSAAVFLGAPLVVGGLAVQVAGSGPRTPAGRRPSSDGRRPPRAGGGRR